MELATIRAALPLPIVPRDYRRAFVTGALSVVGVSAFCVLLDAVLFRSVVPPGYVAFYTGPLWPRTGLISLLALTEELKFRLLLMTALVAIPMAVGKRPTTGWIVAAIIVSQFVNVWPLVLAQPLYAALRFWLVGCVWGWLYWKHGWVTGAAAHCACHLLLDPLLLITLSTM